MTYDVLIRNGRVVDGSGNPWYYGDVTIRGARIAAIMPPGSIANDAAIEQVDAAGMVVCPGFIDIQSHSILPLMKDGRCLSKITQGVTTEIMGEGWTPAPYGGKVGDPVEHGFFAEELPVWHKRMYGWTHFRDWLRAMIRHGVSPNIGSFLGGGTLRKYAKGMSMGAATAGELEVMRRVTAEAMEDGAFGVSYALIYPPNTYTGTPELIEVCKVVARYRGIYITHLRSEADGFLEGLEESFTIGRRANVPVEIYHLKAAGRNNWHKMEAAISMIDAARAAGLDVTCDMYPYTGAGTGLASVLPPWAQAENKFFENLRNAEMRAKIKAEALNPSGGWEAMALLCEPEGIMPIGFRRPENQPYVGKRLSEIAAMRRQDWVDTVFDLHEAEQGWIATVYFMMDEANLRRQLQQPWIKISTDAGGYDPTWGRALGPVHPRSYGTYPRVLGKYVREEQVIPLEDAVRKMTSAVAGRLGLTDRGTLRAGCYADVVIFDPVTVSDCGTFEEPHQLSTGVRDVWVNGGRVLADGVHTGAMPGRIVDGPGRKRG